MPESLTETIYTGLHSSHKFFITIRYVCYYTYSGCSSIFSIIMREVTYMHYFIDFIHTYALYRDIDKIIMCSDNFISTINTNLATLNKYVVHNKWVHSDRKLIELKCANTLKHLQTSYNLLYEHTFTEDSKE